MTKKVLMLAGIILLLSGFSKVLASPNYVIAAYAPGWNSNTSYNFVGNYQTAIPWSTLSHVYFAFATVGGTAVHMSDPNAIAAGLCSYAHANGVRCYISVGGASGNNWPTDTTNDANCSTLATNIADLLTATAGVTFDGIDIDWEVPNTGAPAQSAFFAGLISNLRTDLNSKTPGLAKSGKYPTESNVGLSMYLEAGYYVCDYSDLSSVITDLDWCTQSGYDININVGGDIYQGALTEPTYSFTNCISQSVLAGISEVAGFFNSYSGSQIPYNKMILGMPLYARDASGAATSPDALVGTGTFGTYDTTRCECPTTYGGTSYGVDTAQSFCDKINWALGKGYRGIGMWDLGQGLPTTANSMTTSIWNVLNGTNSCVTVSNGCGASTCTPTVTPTGTPSCGTIISNFENGLTQNNLLGQWSDYIPTGTTATMTNTINDGLNGSIYGMDLSGSTTISNTATFNTGLALAPGTYNASAAGQSGIVFSIRVDQWTGTSQPATILVEMQITGSSGAEYSTTVVVPASYVGNGTFKSGTTYHATAFFSSFSWVGWGTAGTNPMPTTALYLLTFAAQPSSTVNFNYNMTLDDIYFSCPPTPTFTPTSTATATFTNTPSPTKTFTSTFTNTPTNTYTSTFSSTPTNTVAVTSTFTFTPSNTATQTRTNTATFTSTASNTATNTLAATSTFTSTATQTFTHSPTASGTFTSTATNTATATISNTPTITPTFTNTSTGTQPPTGTFTNTPSNTVTVANTATSTFTLTPTNTFSSTITNTPNGPTFTFTNTPTVTMTRTNTSTVTNTVTATATLTYSNTITNTPNGPTATFTNTSTVTETYTVTNTSTLTHTNTVTDTATVTNTFTNTFTPTFTFTFTSTPSFTSTPTMTNTFTASWTATSTYSSTFTPTVTNTVTKTFTPTVTSTQTLTFTPTTTFSATPTAITQNRVSPPFPNPASTGPVEIDVITPSTASIEMEVFTTAFRKVLTRHYTANASTGQLGTVTALQWDLRDMIGKNVSNGLYYVRVNITGIQSSSKIVKVLILR
jgi:GH18 family chitinase